MKKYLLFILYLFIATYSSAIDKTFLKYNVRQRGATVSYAIDNWHKINHPRYKNYGGFFYDDTTSPKTFYPGCTSWDKTKMIDDDCGGDCANFVSQCLIEGGEISHYQLIAGVNSNYIARNQARYTIANAQELGNRLVEMGAKDSFSGGIGPSNLYPGDVIIVPQGSSYHALLVNEGANTYADIQVYGHSPLSQAGVASRGFLGNWPQVASARLIHIPDVPMVERVSVYKRISNSKIVYYEAHFDPSAGGDGATVLDVNKPIFNFFDDNPLYIEVTFDRALNINNKKPVVKIINGVVKKSTSFSSGDLTPQVKIDEFKSISLKDVTGGNVSKADQAKVRVFEYDSDKNYLTGENGNWFLKIEDAVSEMDNTPMNGWGDYSILKRNYYECILIYSEKQYNIDNIISTL